MIDLLGNHLEEGDMIALAVKEGRTAKISTAIVKRLESRPQFAGGAPTNMVLVEWSRMHKYWLPARRVIKIPEEMLPEKRREKLNGTEEAVQPE